MRPILLILLALALVAPMAAQHDQGSTETPTQTLPTVTIKDLTGNTVNTGDLAKDGKPTIVSFWATWCKPCMTELTAYHELYAKWKEEIGAEIYAVSIDDSRNIRKVPGFVNGRGWEFNVLLDENQDFKRAMNVNNVPHTFIVVDGKIVWSHPAFAAGDEEEIEAELRKYAK
jgi:cytochrome c biogenesis protein CcmG, thiol:disulfide interchange protein DsbE